MKLRLVCVGKLSEAYLRDGAGDYAARIRRYLPLEILECREAKAGRKPEAHQLCSQEGEQILAKLPADGITLVLDERGKQLTSVQLAGLLEEHMVAGTRSLNWVIGGAYGLSPAVKQRADLLLSLSPLTLTHQMARLLLLEQIYRGLTIVRNEPYHNP